MRTHLLTSCLGCCANYLPTRFSRLCATACPRFFQRACAKHFLLGYQVSHVSTYCLRLREKPPVYNSATTCASSPVHKPSRICANTCPRVSHNCMLTACPGFFQRTSWKPLVYDSATTCANPPVHKPPRILRQPLAHAHGLIRTIRRPVVYPSTEAGLCTPLLKPFSKTSGKPCVHTLLTTS